MRLKFVFLLTCFIVFIPLSFAFAQGNLPDAIVTCDGADCGLCDLVQLAQNLINIGIFIAIILSAMTFAYAGFLYFSAGSNPAQVGKAKKIFGRVLMGLIIILGSWLAIDTLMKTVMDENNPDFGPWNSIGCGQNLSF